MWRFRTQQINFFFLTLAVCLSCLPASLARPPSRGGGGARFTLVRLAVPGSGAYSTAAYALNDHANVVGEFRDAENVPSGFYYNDASGDYVSLGELRVAGDINHLDNIVGHTLVSYTNGQEEFLIPGRGLYWSSPSAPPILLSPLGGHTNSTAVAINGDKIIVGESYIPEDSPVTPGRRAIVAWYVNDQGAVTEPLVLPLLPNDVVGRANAVTELLADEAIVVGSSGSTPVSWTVTLSDGQLSVAGPYEFTGDYFYGEAYAVNLLGDAVGGADFGEGTMPFLRITGGSAEPLPLLTHAVTGAANSINGDRMIVGYQNVFQNRTGGLLETRAVLWTSPATVVDLNSQVSLGRGEVLRFAADINKRGDILALINGNQSCLLIAK